MKLSTTLFLIGACLGRVRTSIYPTQPVQASVWMTDAPMLVSWVEDGKKPLLNEMGAVDVSLWHGETCLAELAVGVDPTQKTCRVSVPGWVVGRGRGTFAIRFTTSKPVDVVIYSADFTIVPASADGTIATTTGTGPGSATSGVVALAAQAQALSGSGSGFVTGSTGTTGTGANTGVGLTGTTSTASGLKTVVTTGSGFFTATNTTISMRTTTRSTVPSGVPPPSGTFPQGQAQSQRASNAAKRGVDVEKLKFRFVFVIWPVLMGISMAL